MAKNLLIVESPAKAKTIEKYLGKDYAVKSSYGHIRDLPKKDAIDKEKGFEPQYIISDDKKNVVNELKKMAKQVEEVWLATDEDREGEAIAWHLCQVLGLDETTTKRIVFNEITKPAIKKAVQNPRIINRNLVDAQQARRVLDRLVGFEISPVLWRKISRKGGLSAGRVQSVAVRLIVEREREIENFEASSYYKVSAYFKVTNELNKVILMKADLSNKLKDEKTAEAFLQKCIDAVYTIEDIQVKPAKKSPSPPFTTSTLQQEASRKLGYAVGRTMRVAQKLYEAGHITYMRTDSTNLSDTALQAASNTIKGNYGDNYWKKRVFKTKSEGAQEAHEAVRPTNFDNMQAGATNEEQRLYNLIWKRTLASQMADAKLERTKVTVGISTTKEKLTAKGEVLKFDGFLKLYRVSALDEDSEEEQTGMLPPLSVGQQLDLKNIEAIQRFNRPPARYNEASLVRKLEELGIGRPSTYAPTISTVQKRGYVEREDREGFMRKYMYLNLNGPNEEPQNELSKEVKQERTGVERAKLFPTDTGKIVTDFLVKHFQDIFNYDFTAKIEQQFDDIAHGNVVWNNMIDEFYEPFHKSIEYTLENAERESGERELGIDPVSGKKVIARLGKYGAMVQIGGIDDEEKKFASIKPPLTLSTVTLEKAIELFKLPRTLGEFEGKIVKANEGRFGPYVQHNSKFVSLGKELSPLSVTLEQAIELILKKREEDAKKLIKEFAEDDSIKILNGRWGPYIKAGKKNVKIPKDKQPEELTYEEVKELIAKAPEKKKGGRRRGSKKS